MIKSASSNAWRIGLSMTALKMLLIPAYHSTDFEVHRNWMAITANVPMSQWYTEDTSEWTLDYPPLFAWFEWLLAYSAAMLEPAMLHISQLPYTSLECILFQRFSVIITDAVFLSGLWLATKKHCDHQKQVVRIIMAANAGLLIVDHIHFQYNGLLLGILLWSIALIQEGREIAAAFCFALLLNMKHLFAALAPLYFVYLLRYYCRGPAALPKFLALGFTVTAVFALSFVPFVLMGQTLQLMRRLFPFQRGLLHAYWAPNLWALYASIDKCLGKIIQHLGTPPRSSPASMTGGLVQVGHFMVLPDVGGGAAAAFVLASMAPLLLCVWRRPDPARFAFCVALASLNSFMLGYHVHEKAILLSIVPLTLGATESLQRGRIFQRLSAFGHYSLLPLIFTKDEYLVKMLVVSTFSVASCLLLDQTFKRGKLDDHIGGQPSFEMQRNAEHAQGIPEALARGLMWEDGVCLMMLALLELYSVFLHPTLFPRLPFIPLLLTSLFCSLGLVWVWIDLWIACIYNSHDRRANNKHR